MVQAYWLVGREIVGGGPLHWPNVGQSSRAACWSVARSSKRGANDGSIGQILGDCAPGVAVQSKSHRGSSTAPRLRRQRAHGPICTHLIEAFHERTLSRHPDHEDRQQLELLVRGGTGAVRRIKRA